MGTEKCRLDNVLPPDDLWKLHTNCVFKCNYLLFLYSFNKLNLVSAGYSSITSRCVLSEIINVAVHVMSVQTLFIWSPCILCLSFWPFSGTYIQLLQWLTEFTPVSQFHTLRIYDVAAITHLPMMFLPSDLWVGMQLPCVMFTFTSRISWGVF